MLPRGLSLTRRAPRVWPKVLDSIENGYLTDSAIISRREDADIQTPDETFGTPVTKTNEWGPYAAKLSAKVSNDQRREDRQVVETRYDLAIASDVEPVEGDRIIVIEQGGRRRTFRVPGTVNHRRSWWGQTPVWNVELELTEES